MAVFNCHANDAKRRANRAFIEEFGRQVFNRRLVPIFRKGIMSIFEEPNVWTRWWVDKVTEIVNQEEVSRG